MQEYKCCQVKTHAVFFCLMLNLLSCAYKIHAVAGKLTTPTVGGGDSETHFFFCASVCQKVQKSSGASSAAPSENNDEEDEEGKAEDEISNRKVVTMEITETTKTQKTGGICMYLSSCVQHVGVYEGLLTVCVCCTFTVEF